MNKLLTALVAASLLLNLILGFGLVQANRGDINHDNKTNVFDLSKMLSSWSK